MDELPRRKIWLPSPELLVIIGIGLVVSAIAIPGLMSSQRASNERTASTDLRTLTSANADFRANDRDWNHVNDFWTGDVSGLYFVKSPPSGDEVKLIRPEVAGADFKPLFPLSRPCAKSGYLFLALDRDDSVPGPKGEYKVDTDKSGRKVHHLEMFGYSAFPNSHWTGKYVFTINENNTVFREAGTEPRTHFPSDAQLQQRWSIID
jgi:hypothetical protein